MKAAPVLKLLIDGGQGGEYAVEAVEPLPHERRCWRLVKTGAARGHLIVEGKNGKAACECPGWKYRGSCKHVTSLRSLKLLSPMGPAEGGDGDSGHAAGQAADNG